MGLGVPPAKGRWHPCLAQLACVWSHAVPGYPSVRQVPLCAAVLVHSDMPSACHCPSDAEGTVESTAVKHGLTLGAQGRCSWPADPSLPPTLMWVPTSPGRWAELLRVCDWWSGVQRMGKWCGGQSLGRGQPSPETFPIHPGSQGLTGTWPLGGHSCGGPHPSLPGPPARSVLWGAAARFPSQL